MAQWREMMRFDVRDVPTAALAGSEEIRGAYDCFVKQGYAVLDNALPAEKVQAIAARVRPSLFGILRRRADRRIHGSRQETPDDSGRAVGRLQRPAAVCQSLCARAAEAGAGARRGDRGVRRLRRHARRREAAHSSRPPGSCFLWDFRTYHSGTANVSDRQRPMLYAVHSRPWYKDSENYGRGVQRRLALAPDLKESLPKEAKALFVHV